MTAYTVIWSRVDWTGKLTRNATTNADYDDESAALIAYDAKCKVSPSVDLWRGNKCLRTSRHGEEYRYAEG